MKGIAPLAPESVRRRCNAEQFEFATTAELEPVVEIVGQKRAVEAVRFAVGMRRKGYNLFALGPAGVGKRSLILRFLAKRATGEPTPPDWCYVQNFERPEKPRLLRFPPGEGRAFRDAADRLVEELRLSIPSAFDSEEYRKRKEVIEEEIKARQTGALEELRLRAEKVGFAMVQTPAGVVFAAVRDGELLGREEFHKLSAEERDRIDGEMSVLQQEIAAIARNVPVWEREGRGRIRTLDREITDNAVGHLIEEMVTAYAELPEVVEHLERLRRDVVENAGEFLSDGSDETAAVGGISEPRGQKAPFFRRYRANLIVDHSENQGAPVVMEEAPTTPNLIGQVEHVAHMGALLTDFNLIRAGALHRAAGGYLVLDARKVLLQPYAWESLKRALNEGDVRIESLGEMLGVFGTARLEPDPMPLDVKVVLVGERQLYYLLSALDPEFRELFKVAADFEDDIERTPESELLYSRLVANLVSKEKLRPFDREAVARVIEQSARFAESSEKLSMHLISIVDLLREADYCAGTGGRETVSAADVDSAIETQVERLDRVRDRLVEEIRKGTILIETEGAKVGQVNGLSVMQLGQFSFGRPSRITATVRLGQGQVVDIEREVELGGPIHSKGVLILSGFLAGRYASDQPLSLSASLVFEQSYTGVEGDSASSAELYALMSSLAGAAVLQSIAVTGSVNQKGEIQAIGGVNEKIEGFFDVCSARGLTGSQGVLIPSANARHLMLRLDVVEAIRRGEFAVWAVSTVDEGIEVLTGIPAGERDGAGNYPAGTINHLVENRLASLASKRAAFLAREPVGV